MHEEASYGGLDPIESQVRRRAFWLLFGGTYFLYPFRLPDILFLMQSMTFTSKSVADKSMSLLLGRPICLRDEDCTVRFPKEIDDE